jgi:hypothetical protein
MIEHSTNSPPEPPEVTPWALIPEATHEPPESPGSAHTLAWIWPQNTPVVDPDRRS